MVLSPTKVNSLNLMVKKPLPTGCTAKEFPTSMNVLMNMKLQMKIIVSTNPIFISDINLYLEHYAVDQNGKPPAHFGQKYLDEMKWFGNPPEV
jgi:hypothetical protein